MSTINENICKVCKYKTKKIYAVLVITADEIKTQCISTTDSYSTACGIAYAYANEHSDEEFTDKFLHDYGYIILRDGLQWIEIVELK